MTEVTLDAAAIAQLKDAQEQLKVKDQAGRLLGYFLPAQKHDSEVIFGVKSPFPREEIERRLREGAKSARPLREFFAEMEKKFPGQFQWNTE